MLTRRIPRKQKVPRLLAHPPSFSPSVLVSKTFRFQSNAVATTAITFSNLLDIWNVAATATTAYRLFDRVRIRRIEVWAVGATNVPATIYIDWAGITVGSAGPSLRVSDTSVGSTTPAHINAKPPSTAACSLWQAQSTNVAFFISGPINTIIDLHLSGYVDDNGSGTSVVAAPAGATPGANYFRGLDGLVATATIYPPVAYPTD